MADGCVFCSIVAGDAPAQIVHGWPGALAIAPLNPVTSGHVIVLPRVHVATARTDPALTGYVMACAAWYASDQANLITSIGAEATQTVRHLHIHVVPRRDGDGLMLPWSPGTSEPVGYRVAKELDGSGFYPLSPEGAAAGYEMPGGDRD